MEKKKKQTEKEIIDEFDYIHKHKDEIPDYKEPVQKDQFKNYSDIPDFDLLIHPMEKNPPKNIDKVHTQGYFRPSTKEIFLGSEEKTTPIVLWHEQLHKVLLEMFDVETSVMGDKVILDMNEWLKEEEKTGIQKDFTTIPLKDSVFHEIQYFLFGEPETSMNYQGRKKYRKTWDETK